MKTCLHQFAFNRHACLRACGGLFIALVLAVLGVAPALAQATNYVLGTNSFLEGPSAGSDCVVLSVTPATGTWTATTNADGPWYGPWLHLSVANRSGIGSTNVIFSYDANWGPTRTGTLTVAGQTVNITQAGSTYVAALGTALVSSNLNQLLGVAMDGAGNVYIADTGNKAIKKWTPTDNSMTTLVSSGLNQPRGVAVDGAGNVYIADTFNSAIKKWSVANSNVTTLVSSGLSRPRGLAVDGAGNVYIADSLNYAIYKWSVVNSNVTTLDFHMFIVPFGVAVDGAGNVYIADNGDHTIKELPHAFVDAAVKSESAAAGNDTLPVVLPATSTLLPQFYPSVYPSNQLWLTISGIANGVVSFSFAANTSSGGRSANITLHGVNIPINQHSPTFSLGAISLLEGPTAGSDSVVLATVPAIVQWTATSTNVTWLHLSPANQSGPGSTNVIFSYDANPGATRTGTLNIAGQTLTITQAGSTYIPASAPVTTLVSSNLNGPAGVAVASFGGLYFADTYNNAIKQWTGGNPPVSTLVPLGLNQPNGLAVDAVGNVYIADTLNQAVKVWTATNHVVSALVSSGLGQPVGVAVDVLTNIYIADASNSTILKRTAASSNVSTLAYSGFPLSSLSGVAVDRAANLYLADSGNNAIRKWNAADSNMTTLASSGLNQPQGVAVDRSGNVYFSDTFNNAIKKWTAASNSVTTLVASGLNQPVGVAVDAWGYVYIADTGNNAIKALPPLAFLDATPRSESAAAGSDTLSVVLPTNANLLTPTSDQPWLTINSVKNGVVTFSFTTNLGADRTANITLLGQTIPVTQYAVSYSLGTAVLLEGPSAGSDSVVLGVTLPTATWTATANDPWLHLTAANQSGAGSTNVIFSFDANPGVTRIGTLTIAGQTVTVTQAGSTYVVAPGPITTLVSNLNGPSCLAVDGLGNVYIPDRNQILKWTAASNSVTTLNSFYSSSAAGAVAVDGAGNVYIPDDYNGAMKKWSVVDSSLTTIISSGVSFLTGLAVDAAGNLFIAITTGSINKWTPGNNALTPIGGLGAHPEGLAVDAAGNLYSGVNNNTIVKWTAANGSVTTLASSVLIAPGGAAVDGSGNVYFADLSAVNKWVAANNTMTLLAYSAVSSPRAVAVDGLGNVYFADYGDHTIKELPRAFVDPTAKFESADAGTDSLPVVLPATENLHAPFAPTSNQPWLTISGITNGVVSFAFTANLGPNRTANITVLGRSISVTQAGSNNPLTLTGARILGNGSFQFAFSNNVQGASFTVLSTTNLLLPLTNWTVLGSPTNMGQGLYQFSTPASTNDSQRFYGVRSP
ncbi:MAG: hypothetical protein JWR26_1696 [Pedosphaera sp.]|nr:hypothetical protein [Pedosphaera sp.]